MVNSEILKICIKVPQTFLLYCETFLKLFQVYGQCHGKVVSFSREQHKYKNKLHFLCNYKTNWFLQQKFSSSSKAYIRPP